MRRKNLRFLLLSGLLAALLGCASAPPGPWRDAAPDASARLWPEPGPRPLKVGLASLLDVDFSVEGKCDSCHGASANNWEFEYDNILDSVARELWPEAEVLRFAPGVPPYDENDARVDSLTRLMRSWSGSGDGVCEGVDSALVAVGYRVPPEIRRAAGTIAGRYGLDLLVLPGRTAVRLYPSGNTPKGRVEIEHRATVWDLKRGEPLYRSCQNRSWKSSGDRQIDRMTSPLVIIPLAADLDLLRRGWTPPEPR